MPFSKENQLLDLVSRLESRCKERNLSKRDLSQELGIPWATFRKWFTTGKTRRLPSAKYQKQLEMFLEGKDKAIEAYKRVQKIKWLLLLLEDELRWFKDGDIERRDILRQQLNPFDAGYVTSLITMLQDEEGFKRWLALTNYRFSSFRKGGGDG